MKRLLQIRLNIAEKWDMSLSVTLGEATVDTGQAKSFQIENTLFFCFTKTFVQ